MLLFEFYIYCADLIPSWVIAVLFTSIHENRDPSIAFPRKSHAWLQNFRGPLAVSCSVPTAKLSPLGTYTRFFCT